MESKPQRQRKQKVIETVDTSTSSEIVETPLKKDKIIKPKPNFRKIG